MGLGPGAATSQETRSTRGQVAQGAVWRGRGETGAADEVPGGRSSFDADLLYYCM